MVAFPTFLFFGDRLLSALASVGSQVAIKGAARRGRVATTKLLALKRTITRVGSHVLGESALHCRRVVASRHLALEGALARVAAHMHSEFVAFVRDEAAFWHLARILTARVGAHMSVKI